MTDSTRFTGWLFRAEGIEWRWREGLQVRREQIASDSSCKNSGLSEGLQVRREQIGKWVDGVGIWFRVGSEVVSRELDGSSALRWMTVTKG